MYSLLGLVGLCTPLDCLAVAMASTASLAALIVEDGSSSGNGPPEMADS